jgi:hypothetical protein
MLTGGGQCRKGDAADFSTIIALAVESRSTKKPGLIYLVILYAPFDNIAFPLRMRRVEEKRISDQVMGSLALVKLAELGMLQQNLKHVFASFRQRAEADVNIAVGDAAGTAVVGLDDVGARRSIKSL